MESCPAAGLLTGTQPLPFDSAPLRPALGGGLLAECEGFGHELVKGEQGRGVLGFSWHRLELLL